MRTSALKAVIRVLKQRFNNLTAEELIDLAAAILEAVEATAEEAPRG